MWVETLYPQWTSRLMVIPYTTWLVGFDPYPFVHWVQWCSTCFQSDTAWCFQSSSSTQVGTPKSSTMKNPRDPTWCQQVIDEDQEFLIGDLSIGEEEENAFILHTSLGIHGLQISLQIVHAIAATSDQWTMETGWKVGTHDTHEFWPLASFG